MQPLRERWHLALGFTFASDVQGLQVRHARRHQRRILFELGGVNEELGRSAMERAIQKLPIKARFVVRAHQDQVEV